MSLKASISGIRGIVGETLTVPVITKYVLSFCTMLGKGKIVIGRDSRISGKIISKLVKSIINCVSRDVIDLGIVPTPFLLYVVSKNSEFAGGIVITASHNPEEWNALKFVDSSGKFLNSSQFEKLSDLYNNEKFNYATYDKLGSSYKDKKLASSNIDNIINFIGNDLIKKKDFSVGFDTVNGACGNWVEKFLKKIGIKKIESINIKPTGKFAHNPEPTPENLNDLSLLVKNKKLDIGFALDPDGDRLVISDENGNILSEEMTLAICVEYYLTYHKKSDVVINLSTSRMVEDIAKRFERKVIRAKTGEINVTETMEAGGELIGGEGNGGIIAMEINKCRDAFVGMGFILDYMARSNKSIYELSKEIPKYYLIKEKIKVKESDKEFDIDICIDRIKKEFENEYKNVKTDLRDGFRFDFPNGSWLLIRKSNTEPIVRIFAEAKTEIEARNLINSVLFTI